MTKPTVKAINTIRKKYGMTQSDSLSLAQYREACQNSVPACKGRKNFSFEYKLVEISDSRVEIEIIGNHLSKNRYDSLSFREKLYYKKSFKNAAGNLWIKERSRLRKHKTMKKAIISFVFFSRRSRDHDNNAENIKRVQDTLITLGLIEDDKRENLSLGTIDEVISDRMSIQVSLAIPRSPVDRYK